MSNNIGYFEDVGKDEGQPMCVTAFVGKDWDASVQFTIGVEYATVESKYVRCMILNLQNKSHAPSVFVFYEGKQSSHNGIVISTSANIGYTWFEIGNCMVKMDAEQRNELIHILQCRLDGIEGFNATD